MSLKIKTLSLGPIDNLSYILFDEKSKKAMIIDPNWNSKAFLDIINKENLLLEGIIITHTHNDHINALDDIIKFKQNLIIHISEEEKEYWGKKYLNFSTHKNNDIINIGEKQLKVLLTPGHSIGHICLLGEKELFSGDTLFIYGCGHCLSKGSNPKKLFFSLQKIKKLDNNLIVYPGHHYGITKTSTLKEQKKGNPFLLIEDEDEFIDYRMNKHNRSTPYTPIE